MVQWAEDNGWTPLLAVDASHAGVRVPASHVEDNKITLNVGASALHQREIANDCLSGHARFSGRSEYIEVPVAAISALIVRETGEGMVFPEEPDAPPPEGTSQSDSPAERPRGRPQLKVVK